VKASNVSAVSDELYRKLRDLALSVKRMTADGIAKNSIKPQEETLFRWKVDKFQYTEKGITEFEAHEEYLVKPSWSNAAFKLKETVQDSGEYTAASQEISSVFGKENERHLEHFVKGLVDKFVENPEFDRNHVEELVKIFLKDLNQEQVGQSARVELDGVIMQPERIELAHGINLKKTEVEDLERPFHRHNLLQRDLLLTPSAILNVELQGRGPSGIQRKVEQATAILRLFNIGSVKWTRYTLDSESFIDTLLHGTLGAGSREFVLEKYVVTENDIPRIKRFWQTMEQVMPSSFYELGLTKIDYLTIAYSRYSDSLFLNGVFERRIANAVMGLEALFLKSGELQELPYRLSLRISKLFSVLGRDPNVTREMVNDAYRIRSLFAHGGHLSHKERKRVESKYRELKSLLMSLLECLRVSIIIMMVGKKEKDEFIEQIENSFFDSATGNSLKFVVSEVQGLVE